MALVATGHRYVDAALVQDDIAWLAHRDCLGAVSDGIISISPHGERSHGLSDPFFHSIGYWHCSVKILCNAAVAERAEHFGWVSRITDRSPRGCARHVAARPRTRLMPRDIV